jgi:hypothetical protein
MKRRLIIEEEFGVYAIKRGDDTLRTGSTSLEKTLEAAAQSQGATFTDAHSSFDVAELIETLLGPKREESELVHT